MSEPTAVNGTDSRLHADREELTQLIARQAYLRDSNQMEEWIDAYTEDARFTGPRGTHEGREAIYAFAQRMRTDTWRTTHLLGVPVIEVNGDTAGATTDFVTVGPDGGDGYRIILVARYVDSFVRDGDRWRFTERRIEEMVP